MTSDRIQELQENTACPDSISVHSALLQVWNEMQQEFNSRTCENCEFWEIEVYIEQPGYCNKFISEGYCDALTDRDFGCNLFERKPYENRYSEK